MTSPYSSLLSITNFQHDNQIHKVVHMGRTVDQLGRTNAQGRRNSSELEGGGGTQSGLGSSGLQPQSSSASLALPYMSSEKSAS